MRKVGDGSYELDAGESIPVICQCGHSYQPELDSECSDCPACGRLNHHQFTPSLELVEARNEADSGQ